MKLKVHKGASRVSFGAFWQIIAIAASASLATHASAAGSIQLPIEVMPAAAPLPGDTTPYVPPTTASASVIIPQLTGVQSSLWLQIHGSSYEGKMSVQINSGTPILITNSTANLTVADPERSYGGIGGNYPVMQMTLSLASNSDWNTGGPNTVKFIFNGTDGNSCGFRVIGLNVLDGSGNALLAIGDSPGQISYDTDADNPNNPANWTEPRPTDVLAGQALYLGKAYSTNAAPVLQVSPLPGAGTMTASCADCHTLDGHDLRYFNYSNLSIEARSQFHGLTPLQGQQIASYIRSLSGQQGNNPGRPWNPPYQPATNIDSLPVSSWAAGGGVNAVLAPTPTASADQQALTPIFPNGIAPFTGYVNVSQTLNARTSPTTFMLLDWNHWLPRIHPKDAKDPGLGQTFYNSQANHFYDGEGTNSTAVIMTNMATWNGSTTGSTNGWPTVKSALINWENATTALGNPLIAKFTSTPVTGTKQTAQELYAFKQWKQVKMWDVMTTFNLEGAATNYLGSSAERGSWPMTGESFQTSPNRNFIPYTLNAFNNSQVDYEYLNNAWYELQFVLNAGDRLRDGNDPIDWPYIRGRISGIQLMSENAGLPTGYPELNRMIMVIAKGMQQNDGTSHLPPGNVTNGWEPRSTGNISMLVSPNYTVMWAGVTANQKRQILNALTKVWYANMIRYTQAQYYQDYIPDDGAVGPIYVTQPDGTQLKTNGWATEVQDGNMNGGPLLDQVYCMIPYLRTAGVDPLLLNNIVALGANLWPAAGNNWSSLVTPITNTDLATTNLVGRWTFDEGFGTNVVDWSDAGMSTGVLQGTTLPTWVSSGMKVGYGSLSLTSANANTVSVANWPSVTLGSTMTIAGWIKCNSAPTSSTPQITIANTKSSTTATTGFTLYYNPRNNSIDLIGGGSAIAVAQLTAQIDNGWHNIAATVDATNGNAVKLYLDGVSQTMAALHTSVGTITTSSIPLTMGAGLDGQLDDVRIYKYKLEDGDMANLVKVTQ